jgi:hypothetical protein
MALNLSTTGIADGQVITAAQITQSIDALTGTEAYNITISGSFNMGTNTTGSGYFASAVAANTVRPQNIAASTQYTIPYLASTGSTSALYYAATGPTFNPVSETLTVTNLAGSASYATTASYAANTAAVSSISSQIIQNGSTPGIIASANFIAGSATLAGGSPTVTLNIAPLITKILGTTAFPVATYSGSVRAGTPTAQAVQVDSIDPVTGNIIFSGPQTGSFYFHIVYI